MICITTQKYGTLALKFTHVRNDHTITTRYLTDGTKKKKAKKPTYTLCELVSCDDSVGFFGISYLNPYDQFNKAIGRARSLENMLESVPGLDNNTRHEIESAYINRRNNLTTGNEIHNVSQTIATPPMKMGNSVAEKLDHIALLNESGFSPRAIFRDLRELADGCTDDEKGIKKQILELMIKVQGLINTEEVA